MILLAREAMRTRFEIALADDADPAHLRAAGEEALDEIERVEAQLSAYRPDSDLSYVNRRAAEGPIRVEPRFFRFLERAARLSEKTNGAFDPTIGPLLQCWGFTAGVGASPPGEAEVAKARALVGMRENVVLDAEAGTAGFSREGVRLDPGAIGKGYALERAADILREVGVQNALLHGGTSTICALGAPPGMPAWKVAVQHPARAEAWLAEVLLRDESLSVSAVHGKSFRAAGQRFGHVLDPRTGWPVRNSVLAAVAAPSPTDTDALSTGLLVLGRAGLPLLVVRYPDAALLIAYEAPDGSLQVDTVGESFAAPAAAENSGLHNLLGEET